MPVVGIYTKDFPLYGGTINDNTIIVVAETGNVVTYRTTVGALRSALKVSISFNSDSNGEYDASGDGLPNFPILSVYEGNILVSASFDNSTKIISGLNPSTAFTAKFI